MRHARKDIKSSYRTAVSIFDRNIKRMNSFGDERRFPIYALLLGIVTAIVIDLIFVLISYI
ncbi:hypothetical protein AP20H10_03440 [Apilactobacillus apinorum]|uniref:Uncharacterized protein n=1 Tax=Apilactobacillus apinorum TaxID=1218495 RepID=A0ABP9ZGR5_9LACO